MPDINTIKLGDLLPEREFKPDNVQLFLYNSVLWNAHRIHFDHLYATQEEGYPGLVVAGPLMGDWLTQCVLEWLNDKGELISVEYMNRKAAYVGEVLYSGGKVSALAPESGTAELELYVKNEAGEVITPGTALVKLST